MSVVDQQEGQDTKKKLGTTQIIALVFILAMVIVVIIGALTGFGR